VTPQTRGGRWLARTQLGEQGGRGVERVRSESLQIRRGLLQRTGSGVPGPDFRRSPRPPMPIKRGAVLKRLPVAQLTLVITVKSPHTAWSRTDMSTTRGLSLSPKDFSCRMRRWGTWARLPQTHRRQQRIPAGLSQGREVGQTLGASTTTKKTSNQLTIVCRTHVRTTKKKELSKDKLKDAPQGAKRVLLATDENRRGKENSWHLAPTPLAERFPSSGWSPTRSQG